MPATAGLMPTFDRPLPASARDPSGVCELSAQIGWNVKFTSALIAEVR
jgi:hypothetical protein